MGAHALVQAAAFAPGRLRQLVLVDPVIRGPAEYHQPLPPPGTLRPSAQRKNRFASAQEMFERFADRPPYSVFDTQALHDHCQHGLKPAADGQGFELACAPAFEGRIYPTAFGNPGVYASIRALHIPVLVLRARPQDPSVKPWDALGTPTWPALAQEFHFGRDLQLMDKTHMMPMEDPVLVARLIREAMA
jgi:pimeloyl-ACP methyl ester carboxylesterase